MNVEDRILLDIKWDPEGLVVSRSNRFLLIADIEERNGSILKGERVHVHDPGRLREVLYPGNRIRVRRASGKGRSTGWDLITGKVGEEWVLVNSSLHRRISEMLLTSDHLSPIKGIKDLRSEVTVGSSRLDHMLELDDGSICYVEVKGCTLVNEGMATFPDAPTSRGTKHLRELISLRSNGIRAAVLFLVLSSRARYFSPNRATDPLFSATFDEAMDAGVEIYPYSLKISDERLVPLGQIPICQ